ncbi:MAG: PBP1A family penicillin-binding protein, partial [Gaiellaceae bacterium]
APAHSSATIRLLLRRPFTSAAPLRRRRIRKLRLLALLAVLGLLGLSSFTFGLVSAIASQIPALDPSHRQEVNGYIYAGDGKRILTVLRGSQARVLVPYSEISPQMTQAIVAIEDKRFFEHRGLDVRGMSRALWADATHGGVVQGGSTITQQFVKNAFVRNERSIARKLKEAALSWQLEQRWSKEKILTSYLNTIYFGNGAYGVQQAALTYFGHGASALTLPQAALLAGIPEDPSLWDPVANPKNARHRREVVLGAMLDQHEISRADYDAANATPLPRPQDVHLPGTEGPAQYFVNYVEKQLVDQYGTRAVFGGGLKVQTTIDLRLQDLARQAIATTLRDPNGPSAALVALDPRTGEVLAMVGGSNYRQSQFNLAVQGERQAGSSFKPFVLATALREGISPATTLTSAPQQISLGDRFWSVKNYENAYLGPIDLHTATVESDNTVYAQLTRLVGPAAVADTAHELGITSPLHGFFSIGLGAEPVNPLEMARAYATFANGGARVDGKIFGNEPRAIRSVVTGNGHLQDNRVVPRQKLSPAVDAELTSILTDVVRSGTGTHAALPDRPVAGKTGTTENYGDAWFVGYTPQLVTAVWVGYPTTLRPMLTEYHGQPVAGGTFPAEIWKSFTETALALRGDQPEQFPYAPSELASAKRVTWRDGSLQLDNGFCRDTSEVVYTSGRGPAKTADCKPNEVDVPSVVGQSLSSAQARLEGQPLTPVLVYKPAAPRQRLDRVLAQYPRSGRLSSHDKVTIVLAKPLHGVVPDLVGHTLRDARRRLRKVQLSLRVGALVDGTGGRIVSQEPAAGVAAAPGMQVTLSVARG